MLVTASGFWTVVVVALAAVVIVWVLNTTLFGPPVISLDTNASPSSETQPVNPPAPVPAMRPTPTP